MSIDVFIILSGLGCFAFWFFRGLIRDKDKARDEADEAYIESLRKNREADRMLDDPEYKRRLFEEDNKG